MSSSMYSISSSPPHVSQCCNHLKPARVFSKHWPSLERRIFQTQQILPGKDAYCLAWLRGRASGNEWRLGATRHLFVSRLGSSSSLSSHYHHSCCNRHLRHLYLYHHHHRDWMATVRDTRHLFVPCLPSNPLGGPGLFNRKTEKKWKDLTLTTSSKIAPVNYHNLTFLPDTGKRNRQCTGGHNI